METRQAETLETWPRPLKGTAFLFSPHRGALNPAAKQLARKHLNISFKRRICQLAREVIPKLYTNQNEGKERGEFKLLFSAFVANVGSLGPHTTNLLRLFFYPLNVPDEGSNLNSCACGASQHIFTLTTCDSSVTSARAPVGAVCPRPPVTWWASKKKKRRKTPKESVYIHQLL